MDWQTNYSQIRERAGHLLKNGQWSDCAFTFGSDNANEVVYAHKLILAMTSPVFQAMFYGEMADKENGSIEILDVQPEAFKALLKYIYTDEVVLKSFDQVCEICYAAKKYIIPHMVERCTQFIWQDINTDNVCRAYEFARLFEDETVLEKCLTIIRNETEAIIRDPSFEKIDAITIKFILEQDCLEVSELGLWEGCMRWSREECLRQSLEPTPTNQRKVIGDNIFIFRFMTLSPTQFANGPAQSGVLSQEESFSLLMNISSPGVAPMPLGFNDTVVKRQLPCYLRHSVMGSSTQLQCVFTGPVSEIFLNDDLVDRFLTFSVSTNICVIGIVLPTQQRPIEPLPESETHQQLRDHHSYPELIYAFLQDCDEYRMTYTHFAAKVQWENTVEIIFNNPVNILPHKTYKICVVLNKGGRYPLYSVIGQMDVRGTIFNFVNNPQNCVIKSLIYSNDGASRSAFL